MTKINIGLTSITLGSDGGISRYVYELAKRFSPNYETHIVSSKQDAHDTGAIIHTKPILWSPISLQVASVAWQYTKAMKDLKKRGVVDVFHSQGAECLGPDVLTAHSLHTAAIDKIKKERGLLYRMCKPFEPRSNIVCAIERHNMRHSRRIIAISESIKREIIHYHHVDEEKIDVIYNGVDGEVFHPRNRKKYLVDVRKICGLSQEDIVLLFVGWEFKRKGLQYVIEALSGLPKHVKLLVVGGGDSTPYRNLTICLGLCDRIVFMGHRCGVEKYYAASDLFVFPVSYEPFGLVITEAMSSGVGVVTSRCAGAAELITDGVDGLLLEDPYSSVEVCEKIKYVIENKLLRSLGGMARKKAEVYSWDVTAQKTIDSYKIYLEKGDHEED